MKKLGILIAIINLLTLNCNAQSYLEHLQQQQPGQGSVVVKQSADITELVNGKDKKAENAASQTTNNNSKTNKAADDKEEEKKDDTIKHEYTSKQLEMKTDDDEADNSVDTRKKVMRGAYKVDGYRVQVYAGGNSRENKQKAEEAGRKVKAAFPGLPVYVHFYSPQWKCRMGNFRTREDAEKVLKQVRSMGYKQAILIKTKITVQY